MTYEVRIDGQTYRVELERGDQQNGWRCRLDGRELALDAVFPERDLLSLLVAGRSYEIKREIVGSELHVVLAGVRRQAEVRDPRTLKSRRTGAAAAGGPRKLVAPMPGKVVRLLVAENDAVEAGQGVAVIEAMKMQNELKSPKKGVVRKILAREGAAVNAGETLAVVE
jgi:biotin carboxyl carrier protein